MAEELAQEETTAQPEGSEAQSSAQEPQQPASTLMTAEEEAATAGQEEGGKEKAGAAPDNAEPYTLTAPEGYPISAQELESFTKHCNELGITKEQAEKTLTMFHRRFQDAQDQFISQRKAWISEIQADKDFGGDNFKSTVADAKRALSKYDEDGTIRKMLDETGYGDNPAVIKIFAKVGRELGEDKIIGKGGAGGKKPLAERLYPDM